MTSTAEAREAWDKQAMYDTAIARAMALKCTQWALYAPGAKFNPFDADRRFEAARAAFTGHDAMALHTYARGYVEDRGLGLELEMPTPEKLARWLHLEDCPAAERADSESRLSELYQKTATWYTLTNEVGAAVLVMAADEEELQFYPLGDVFSRWYRATDSARHPLAPLMKAWFASRPRPADTTRRERERIIPAKVAMAPSGDRRVGKLFSVAAHVEQGQDDQLVMPGFQHDRQAPALPLALYDLGLGALEHRARNPAAPLALRLWVASILLTKQQGPTRHPSSRPGDPAAAAAGRALSRTEAAAKRVLAAADEGGRNAGEPGGEGSLVRPRAGPRRTAPRGSCRRHTARPWRAR